MCPAVCAGMSSNASTRSSAFAPWRSSRPTVTRIAAKPSRRPSNASATDSGSPGPTRIALAPSSILQMVSSVNAGRAVRYMTEAAIIQLPQWLRSPVGQVLLEWEQRHLDHAVADVFGFHALQLGLPQLEALQANRMPHRWLAVESAADAEVPGEVDDGAPASGAANAEAEGGLRV